MPAAKFQLTVAMRVTASLVLLSMTTFTLALIIGIYRTRDSVNLEELDLLKG